MGHPSKSNRAGKDAALHKTLAKAPLLPQGIAVNTVATPVQLVTIAPLCTDGRRANGVFPGCDKRRACATTTPI
jgi:hypothetical protein